MSNRTFRAACLFPEFEYRDIFIKEGEKFILLEASTGEEMEKKLEENQEKLMFFIDENSPRHLFGAPVSCASNIIIFTRYRIKGPYHKGIAT